MRTCTDSVAGTGLRRDTRTGTTLSAAWAARGSVPPHRPAAPGASAQCTSLQSRQVRNIVVYNVALGNAALLPQGAIYGGLLESAERFKFGSCLFFYVP
jgi:hypothetical protein